MGLKINQEYKIGKHEVVYAGEIDLEEKFIEYLPDDLIKVLLIKKIHIKSEENGLIEMKEFGIGQEKYIYNNNPEFATLLESLPEKYVQRKQREAQN